MDPFWIETGNRLRLAIVPRPRGGDWLEGEMAAIKKAGVDEGFSSADAFQRISLARGLQVPDTHEQVLWVKKFAAHV